jgi:hypothetical protein
MESVKFVEKLIALIFDRTFSCYADDLAAELRNRPEYVRYN